MKGNPKVIKVLQSALTEELTAINQYFIHAELCKAWGFKKLHDEISPNSIDEMKHAEKLIGRILFLEGTPNMSDYLKISVGQSVEEILKYDMELELMAVMNYNKYIGVSDEAGDSGSRDFFLTLLKDEESHVEWLESQMSQIEQVGMQNYLASKM